ncbi:MAG: hypothetical protein ACKVXR_18590 [Planctomycetota bacterium]
MRAGILIVAAALVLGGLLYVTTRSAKAPDSASRLVGRADATPDGSEQLSTDLSDEESRAPAERAGLESAPAVAPAPEPEMHPENSLIPSEELAIDASAASIDFVHPPGSEFLKNKYAGRSAKQRSGARERLKSLLDSHEAGAEEPGRALTEAQVRAIRIEIDWLKSNPGS